MMNRPLTGLLVAVALAAPLVSYSQPRPDYSKGRRVLRLMSYNVGVFDKYIDDSAPMIASMIKEIDADAVAVNEQDSCNRRHDRYQTEYLAECLGGWNYSYRSAMPYVGGGYGEGLVTKDRIRDRFDIMLPKGPGSEPRVCVVVETRKYVFASTHLDHVSEEARAMQARLISETLVARYGSSRKPVFLCGDMNSELGKPTLDELQKHFTIISKVGNTYSSRDPHVAIDFIMVLRNKAKVKPLKSDICTWFESGDVKDASDHLPVFADVKL